MYKRPPPPPPLSPLAKTGTCVYYASEAEGIQLRSRERNISFSSNLVEKYCTRYYYDAPNKKQSKEKPAKAGSKEVGRTGKK